MGQHIISTTAFVKKCFVLFVNKIKNGIQNCYIMMHRISAVTFCLFPYIQKVWRFVEISI